MTDTKSIAVVRLVRRDGRIYARLSGPILMKIFDVAEEDVTDDFCRLYVESEAEERRINGNF